MSRYIARLLPATIAAQTSCLVVVAVLLGIGIACIVRLSFSRDEFTPRGATLVTATRAADIAAVVLQARAARSADDLERVLQEARRSGTDVHPTQPGAGPVVAAARVRSSTALSALVARLKERWRLNALQFDTGSGGQYSIVLGIDDQPALTFRGSDEAIPPRHLVSLATSVAATITLLLIFLYIYALRWMTTPLTSMASAALAFGRSTTSDELLREEGPTEIAQVAKALNEMRRRIRLLVAERTRMLAAIGHDLRTPLTRLALRAERVEDTDLREGMLHEITNVNALLGETLAYLRDGYRGDPSISTDLPSLCRTIVAEFSDVGYEVEYRGPHRLAFPVRMRALARAITNLVDNAVKHGTAVMVTLQRPSRDVVEIEVSDNGPGIPLELRAKVLEPFFKIDSARSSTSRPTGFGLGLSIVHDVVERHGGTVQLLERNPTGLTVRLSLSRTVAEESHALNNT